MGGEPTFVSIDDYDAPEWNTAAVGAAKQERAETLIRRLRDSFRPGRPPALRPGQMVSRRKPAALGLCALLAQGRQPIWHDPLLIAGAGAIATATDADAQALVSEMATRLGIEPDYVIPAYEDAAVLAAAGKRAAGQRRSVRPEDRRSRRARAHGAHLRPRLVASDWVRVAGATLERGGAIGLAQRTLAAPARPALSGAGRLSGRLCACR